MPRFVPLFLCLFLLGCPGAETGTAPPPLAPPAAPDAPDAPGLETPDTPTPPTAEDPKGPEGLDASKDAEQAIGLMASSKDPVCGKDIGLNEASVTHQWGDVTYVLCSEACLQRFKSNPKAHMKKTE